MGIRTCFLMGHRDVTEDVLPDLRREIERHITEYGVTEFVVGNKGAFDRLATKVLRELRIIYPGISVVLLLPYYPAVRQVDLSDSYDSTFYPPGMESVPKRFAITRANRYMVDHADYMIVYCRAPASNTRNLLNYARKRGQMGLITVSNIADNERL